jgi:hypothetical protein
MAELVNKFIDPKGKEELTWVVDTFGNIIESIAKVNSKGIKIEMDIKGASSLKELVDYSSQLKTINSELLEQSKKFAQISKLEAQTDLLKTRKEEVNSRMDNKRAIQEESDKKRQATEIDKQAKQALNEYISDVKKGQKELDSLAVSYERKIKAAQKAAGDQATKDALKQEAEYAAKTRQMVKELGDEIEKSAAKTEKDIAAVQKLNTAYNILNEAHKKAVLLAQEAGAQFGTESEKFINAANDANRLGNKLYDIDAKLGNYRRNVGNYSSQWNGLRNSVNQLVRELPSAAVGLNTFFLAISNNIPILMDELKKVREENALLIAQGQESVSVWSQVSSAIFSWQTAVIVLVTILATKGQDIIRWVKNLGTAAEQAQSRIQSLDKGLEDLARAREEEINRLETNAKINEARAKTQGKTQEDIEKNVTKVKKEEEDKRIRSNKEYVETLQQRQNSIAADVLSFTSLLSGDEDDDKELQTKIDSLKTKWHTLQKDIEHTQDDTANRRANLVALGYEDEASKLTKAIEDEKRAAEIRIQLAEKIEVNQNNHNRTYFENSKRTQEQIIVYEKSRIKENEKDEEDSLDTIMAARWKYHNDVISLAGIDFDNKKAQNLKEHKETIKTINELRIAESEKYKLRKLENDRFREQDINDSNEFLKKSEDAIADYVDKSTEEVNKRTTDKIAHTLAGLKSLSDYAKLHSKGFTETYEDAAAKLEKRLQTFEKLITLFKGMGEVISNLYDKPIQRLQDYMDMIDVQKDLEIANINQKGLAEKDRLREVGEAEARAANEKIETDRKIKQAQREKAIFEKAMTITEIIAETALASIRALGMKPYTPYNIAQAEIVAGIGAMKLAAAIAAPIPGFKGGTKNSPEGLAYVGEEGREMRINKDGSIELTPSTKTLTHLEKGTQIIPNKETEQIIDAMTLASLGGVISFTEKQRGNRDLIDAYYNSNDRSANKIVRAIKENRSVVNNGDSNWGNYYHNKFKS